MLTVEYCEFWFWWGLVCHGSHPFGILALSSGGNSLVLAHPECSFFAPAFYNGFLYCLIRGRFGFGENLAR